MESFSKIEDPGSQDIFERIESYLPDFFARSAAEKWTGGMYKGSYLANLGKKGPIGHRVGNKVLIFKKDFVNWLRARERRNSIHEN